LGLLFALLFVTNAVAAPAQLVPAEHGDFDIYTFALTWQPGICSIDDGPMVGADHPEYCLSRQPRTPLIGLHGLWPSLPDSLSKANVTNGQWLGQGCEVLRHSDAPPSLSADLQAKLAAVMPQFETSLLTHEWDKHAICFGFDPAQFFTAALAMRQAVADAPFGRYLVAHAGQTVAHDDVVAAWEKSFGTTDARSIALECFHDSSGRQILTQLWITARANALAAFPAATSLTHIETNQDSCPATFFVPSW
jgi:ribonuclease I (enterobacter ribonuclease)